MRPHVGLGVVTALEAQRIPDVAVGVDQPRNQRTSSQVYDLGARRDLHLGGGPHRLDSAVADHYDSVALWFGAGSVDQGGADKGPVARDGLRRRRATADRDEQRETSDQTTHRTPP